VEPFARALKGFDAWITGRKRFHGGARGALPTIEADAGRVKINPLATWSRERILAQFATRRLPPHPLVADGYLSIGCMPCTARVKPGQGVRDGRWAGQDKDECGIHLPMGGGLGL
jgi:phosphoadenosine phosphosulfate reductase